MQFVFDGFFKYSMGNINIAQDFFKGHVPEEILRAVDLFSLELCSGEFIADDLKNSQVDILYRAKLLMRPDYIYFLVEQQTSYNRDLLSRVLGYNSNIVKQHINQHQKSHDCWIYTIVLYNGKARLPKKHNLYNQKHLQYFKFVDLQTIPSAVLHSHGDAAVFELILQKVNSRELRDLIQQVNTAISHVRQGILKKGFILEMAVHIMINRKVKESDNFSSILHSLLSLEEGEMQTIADRLIDQGLRQGRNEEKYECARGMSSLGMAPAAIAQVTNLKVEEITKFLAKEEVV